MPCSPNVAFCGYSIPHPTENMIYVRVQTVGMPVLLSCHCFTAGHLLDAGRGREQQGLPPHLSLCVAHAGDVTAEEAFKEAINNLKAVCGVMKERMETALEKFRAENPRSPDAMVT